ncbi:hypothetical protein HPB51_004879 [Rhipicephalus microplus]|uniref:Uncharacterized protein n=1 Tax=Rhipicephalus microplus TaxID=6941 RepID=A0A9J6E6A1_RHIMP|nr:hypothetical protein HPB51_004879 [Rhipicephalus microplus]
MMMSARSSGGTSVNSESHSQPFQSFEELVAVYFRGREPEEGVWFSQLANHGKEFFATFLPALHLVGYALHKGWVSVEHLAHELAPTALESLPR